MTMPAPFSDYAFSQYSALIKEHFPTQPVNIVTNGPLTDGPGFLLVIEPEDLERAREVIPATIDGVPIYWRTPFPPTQLLHEGIPA